MLWTTLENQGEYIKLSLDVEDHAVVYTALNDKVIRVDNVQEDMKFFRNLDGEKKMNMKTVLSYPIKNQEEKTFAVLELINKYEGRFTNEDEELLALISYQISNILHLFLEYENFQQNYCKFRDLYSVIKIFNSIYIYYIFILDLY